MKMKEEAGVIQLEARNAYGHQKLEEARNTISSVVLEKMANTLILNFCHPKQGEKNHF